MNRMNLQQQTQNKVRYQSMSAFLEKTPPNKSAYISDLAAWENTFASPYLQARLRKPDLNLHCSTDSCNQVMIFRSVVSQSAPEVLVVNDWRYLFIFYVCSNCQKEHKVFSLAAMAQKFRKSHGICYKIGEFPPYGPLVPSKLISLIGPDRETFLQGHRCENQGFGIGAFVYYRRVVENQKNLILTRILKVAEKLGATQDTIDKLNAAIKETQFKKAIDMAKDVIPDRLFINNQNPILVLHHVLSGGVHDFSDERCLELARDVRVVLSALSERLSLVLKEDAEVGSALSNLMNLNRN